jgi:hypothetical protein
MNPSAEPCAFTDLDCERDWDALAVEAGFSPDPAVSFFEFAEQGCQYDTSPPPRTIDELIQISSPIALGTISSIEPRLKYPLVEEAPYYVYMGVEPTDAIVGDPPETILVSEPCSHAAKVAGLRRSLPEQTYLFFLGGPYERPMTPEYYGLQFYGLGIVSEQTGSLSFEHKWHNTEARPPLSQFGSLADLAAYIREKKSLQNTDSAAP